MKKRKLKEMIKAAFIAENYDDAALKNKYDFLAEEGNMYEAEEDLDEMIANLDEADEDESIEDILTRITGTSVDPYQAEGLAEAEGDEEETDVEVDAEAETTDGGEEKNDSIVVDKKIVSLSSLPNETRKILDSLETLRAQAEEFGDQKFITQVGNTITFFTRDFVVAGDEPTRAKVDESLEILKMKKLAGLLTEGEYAKALLRENQTNFPSEDEIKRKGAVGDSVTVSKDGKNYDINYTISSESDDEMSFGIYDSEEGEDAEQIEEFYTYKELINWFNN
jgi:beta-glucosidase-like glycosyl hydrolase